MCAITGLLSSRSIPTSQLLQTMADAMTHRGPDDSGVWTDSLAGIGLAHRRLAIIDLSPAGHQPMHSACGRYVIVFNGEIYNWAELRAELESTGKAPIWRGNSDTEVLLEAIAAWGLPAALMRSRGMFALALWDRAERCLILSRDRIGEKPLYYGTAGDAVVFASELKALRALPHWRPEVDGEALAQYMRYGYVPAPHSIYRGIHKLLPGTWLRIEADGRFTTPLPWWSFEELIGKAVAAPLMLSGEAAIDALEGALREAVREQMVADVPLGALLSGGLDSSVIVALMQQQSRVPVRTFTIGFAESRYDEAPYAKAVARHLGTEHTELYVSPAQALAVIPHLPDMYDEPFADSSQIPTSLVCAMTRQHVTVCLSGDAGDELLGGYNRYFWARRLWPLMEHLPAPLRGAIAGILQHWPASVWSRVFEFVFPLLPTRLRVANAGDKLHKLAQMIELATPEALYQHLVSQWRGPLPLRGAAAGHPTILRCWPSIEEYPAQMMAMDTLTYLPDDILAKVDRAAMAASLETRVPYLDPRVIELAWRLPLDMKIRNGQGKWLLRQLLARHVPPQLFERPKQGFSIPLDVWLRGPLREWAESLLDVRSLAADEWLDPAPIRAMWQAHLDGRNFQHGLWNVLMYQSWKKRWQ